MVDLRPEQGPANGSQAFRFLAMTPQKRIADPSELAAAVVWLCSDEASFVTGVNFPVDGGMLVS